jgi:hypothetical protein
MLLAAKKWWSPTPWCRWSQWGFGSFRGLGGTYLLSLGWFGLFMDPLGPHVCFVLHSLVLRLSWGRHLDTNKYANVLLEIGWIKHGVHIQLQWNNSRSIMLTYNHKDQFKSICSQPIFMWKSVIIFMKNHLGFFTNNSCAFVSTRANIALILTSVKSGFCHRFWCRCLCD